MTCVAFKLAVMYLSATTSPIPFPLKPSVHRSRIVVECLKFNFIPHSLPAPFP